MAGAITVPTGLLHGGPQRPLSLNSPHGRLPVVFTAEDPVVFTGTDLSSLLHRGHQQLLWLRSPMAITTITTTMDWPPPPGDEMLLLLTHTKLLVHHPGTRFVSPHPQVCPWPQSSICSIHTHVSEPNIMVVPYVPVLHQDPRATILCKHMCSNPQLHGCSTCTHNSGTEPLLLLESQCPGLWSCPRSMSTSAPDLRSVTDPWVFVHQPSVPPLLWGHLRAKLSLKRDPSRERGQEDFSSSHGIPRALMAAADTHSHAIFTSADLGWKELHGHYSTGPALDLELPQHTHPMSLHTPWVKVLPHQQPVCKVTALSNTETKFKAS